MVPPHIRNEVLDAWSAVRCGDATIEHLRSIQNHATAGRIRHCPVCAKNRGPRLIPVPLAVAKGGGA